MNDVIGLAREQRVRERAYQLWEEAGKPEGEQLDHWSRATEAIAVEDAQCEPAAGESTEPVKRIDRLAS
jgi:hypothetical protein